MTTLSHVPRDEKRRIASEIHTHLVDRATSGPPDSLLDPFITKTKVVHDALATQVEDKNAAQAERSALLVENDRDDDEVDRWYRHIYRYLETEALRNHSPVRAEVDALLKRAYPEGLDHVDDRVPDQNIEVRRTLTTLRNPEVAHTLGETLLPSAWLDALERAVGKSEASFSAYEAALGDVSTAVTMGRDAEGAWITWARALSHAIALRSSGASAEVVEEGKQILAPLTGAVKLLRARAKTRATKKKGATP